MLIFTEEPRFSSAYINYYYELVALKVINTDRMIWEVNVYDLQYDLSSSIRYNKGTYIHVAGNGVHSESRSNAHTLDWEGNAWFAGDVYVDSTSGTNKDNGSKKLATENYVNE